jgi:hypothetical protein
VEGFPKPGEGKSKSLGRKFKARGSEFQASFFRESRLFNGLQRPVSETAKFEKKSAAPFPSPGERGRRFGFLQIDVIKIPMAPAASLRARGAGIRRVQQATADSVFQQEIAEKIKSKEDCTGLVTALHC